MFSVDIASANMGDVAFFWAKPAADLRDFFRIHKRLILFLWNIDLINSLIFLYIVICGHKLLSSRNVPIRI